MPTALRGPSRASLADLRAALDGVPATDRRSLAAELFAVRDLVTSSHALTRTLTDQATAAAGRTALLERLLGGRVSPAATAIAGQAVGARWARPRDLAESLEELGNEAVLGAAEADGRLDAVEDDLFRFSRILERSPALALALSDPATPDTAKADLVGRLLEGKADPDAIVLTRRAVLGQTGLPLERALTDLVTLAASRRLQLVAVVEAARPLSDAQTDRLAAALRQIYGKAVRVQADIDPTLLGGLTVHVGDEVIDGSVLRRLVEARAQLAR